MRPPLTAKQTKELADHLAQFLHRCPDGASCPALNNIAHTVRARVRCSPRPLFHFPLRPFLLAGPWACAKGIPPGISRVPFLVLAALRRRSTSRRNTSCIRARMAPSAWTRPSCI